MKVLFVLGFPNPFPSAAWARVGFFAKSCSKKHHSVEILGTFSLQTLNKRGVKNVDGCNVFNLSFNLGFYNPVCFIFNFLFSFLTTFHFLLARRPKITVISVPTGDTGLGAIMACTLLKASFIIDYRDEWEDYAISQITSNMGKPFYYIIKKFASHLYAKSKKLVTVTPNMILSLKKRGLTNIILLPNGADTSIFKIFDRVDSRYALSLNKNDFIIIHSGGIGGYYRVDIAIKAIAKMGDYLRHKVKLLLVGSGSDVTKIMHISKLLGLEHNVMYLGIKNDKTELAKLFSTADVGLIPYDDNLLWKNSLPAKFFEYCACGLPVIATAYDDSLIANLIKEHQLGLFSHPMDEAKLADTIQKIFTDKNFRVEAGKRARLLVESKYDRNKIAENFHNLLKGVI